MTQLGTWVYWSSQPASWDIFNTHEIEKFAVVEINPIWWTQPVVLYDWRYHAVQFQIMLFMYTHLLNLRETDSFFLWACECCKWSLIFGLLSLFNTVSSTKPSIETEEYKSHVFAEFLPVVYCETRKTDSSSTKKSQNYGASIRNIAQPIPESHHIYTTHKSSVGQGTMKQTTAVRTNNQPRLRWRAKKISERYFASRQQQQRLRLTCSNKMLLCIAD